MADQTIQFLEGIAKDIMVRIHDHYAPADFMVLDMGEEDDDTPITLRGPFLNTTNMIIYVENGLVKTRIEPQLTAVYKRVPTGSQQ